MLRNKWLWAGICVVMGGLQAWDSGTLRAPGLVQAIVALAIAVPAVTVVMTSSYARQALSVAVAFVPAVLIFFSHVVEGKRAAC